MESIRILGVTYTATSWPCQNPLTSTHRITPHLSLPCRCARKRLPSSPFYILAIILLLLFDGFYSYTLTRFPLSGVGNDSRCLFSHAFLSQLTDTGCGSASKPIPVPNLIVHLHSQVVFGSTNVQTIRIFVRSRPTINLVEQASMLSIS